MRSVQLGATVALATVSQAFLLPPTISSHGDFAKALPFEHSVEVDERVLTIPCLGCPVLSGIGSASSMLRLNVSIAHETTDQLLLNDVAIFPFSPLSLSSLESVTAPQLIKTPGDTWAEVTSVDLGYALTADHVIEDVSEDLNLIALRLVIFEVAGEMVPALSPVEMKLVQTPSGKLMIGSVLAVGPDMEGSPVRDDTEADECTGMLCKLKSIFADKTHHGESKGCAGKGHSASEPGAHAHAGDHPGHRIRPHHYHHHHSRVGRILHTVVTHFAIPLLFGISLGIFSACLGTVVGNLVVCLWRAFHRKGRQSKVAYTKLAQEESPEDLEEETGDEDHQDLPPVYEEAVAEKDEE